MTKSQRLATILEAAKINTRRVLVLGSFAHIDTFEKYEGQISDLMSKAGFKLHSRSNGRHMDSFDGFRLVYQLAA